MASQCFYACKESKILRLKIANTDFSQKYEKGVFSLPDALRFILILKSTCNKYIHVSSVYSAGNIFV